MSVTGEPDPILHALVRRDIRLFIVGAVLAVAVAGIGLFWFAGIIPGNDAASLSILVGAVAIGVGQWGFWVGGPRIWDRLFVMAPGFLASPSFVAGIGYGSGGYVAIGASFLLALGASAALGITWKRRER
jgi:hypothetical protein